MGKTDDELRGKLDELMAKDLQQVQQVRQFGVDLAKTRQIDLTFWAPDERTAEEFAAACTRNEMPPHTLLGPGRSETNRRWLVRCSIAGTVGFVTEKENIATFMMFADKYNCEYDGWGTAIVEAAVNLQEPGKTTPEKTQQKTGEV
jgi:hypothetical protein